jgi:phosphoglycerate dehydrogenase-like enzyme
MTGLDRFDGEPAGPSVLLQPRVVVVPHRAWPVRLLAALIRRLRGSHRAPRVR